MEISSDIVTMSTSQPVPLKKKKSALDHVGTNTIQLSVLSFQITLFSFHWILLPCFYLPISPMIKTNDQNQVDIDLGKKQ